MLLLFAASERYDFLDDFRDDALDNLWVVFKVAWFGLVKIYNDPTQDVWPYRIRTGAVNRVLFYSGGEGVVIDCARNLTIRIERRNRQWCYFRPASAVEKTHNFFVHVFFRLLWLLRRLLWTVHWTLLREFPLYYFSDIIDVSLVIEFRFQ